ARNVREPALSRQLARETVGGGAQRVVDAMRASGPDQRAIGPGLVLVRVLEPRGAETLGGKRSAHHVGQYRLAGWIARRGRAAQDFDAQHLAGRNALQSLFELLVLGHQPTAVDEHV